MHMRAHTLLQGLTASKSQSRDLNQGLSDFRVSGGDRDCGKWGLLWGSELNGAIVSEDISGSINMKSC